MLRLGEFLEMARERLVVGASRVQAVGHPVTTQGADHLGHEAPPSVST
ncbi:MAG: hypothetical protein ACLQBX_02745 [Candidatus Limnocylindrales bacterium]